MSKRLSAKTGEYTKDGETKGEYTQIGVILQNDNGEYLLLDPTINLAGVLAKQNILALNQGRLQRQSNARNRIEDYQAAVQLEQDYLNNYE